MRAWIVAMCFLIVAGATVALAENNGQQTKPAIRSVAAPLQIEESVPPHVDPPPPPPSPVPPPPPPSPKAAASPRPKPEPKTRTLPNIATGDISAYRGMGAWVDVYDYAIRDQMDPTAAVDEMARRGVKTLYLQTGRWKEANDIVNTEKVNLFLDRADARNIKVIAWYVPGFGDIDRDIRRSVAAMTYRTPRGNKFDGFAPDIETREEVGGDRDRFNAGIIEYSRRLREVAPTAVLAAIVVDAKNNERAPARWEGFPWPEIGQMYDIVMPMAYWSVTKSNDCGREIDVATYMRQVAEKTTSLMGTARPMHIIGGIADCNTVAETSAYVSSMKELGSVGGSLYDFATTEANPSKEDLWRELARLNS